MSKRRRFILFSVLLSLGFIGIQYLDVRFKILAILGLSLLTGIFFAVGLWEGLGLNLTLLTLILPAFFTAGIGFFWFLLPVNFFTRLPLILIYGLGVYALFLTMNLFTVGAIRTIALLRAGRGVGFVLTLATSFLIFNAILSLKIYFWWSGPLIALFSFPLFLQGFWSVVLNKEFSKNIFLLSLVSALAVGEIAIAIFFWPVTLVTGSVFLTVAVYILLGLGQAKLEGRFFAQTVRDYLLVGILVFAGMLVVTRWAS